MFRGYGDGVSILPAPGRPATSRFSRSGRLWARGAAVLAGSVLLLGLGAGTALAHVTVNPNTATAGSYAKLTFRVPTESDTASTVSVRVALPTDSPFASVSTQPVPGWTATTETKTFDPPLVTGKFTLTEATSAVTWTADDGVGVKPGEFQEFSLSVGPVPDVASLTFPATQTYSDGTVVQWSEVAADGADPHSLDHPAPLLTITSSTDHGTSADTVPGSDTTAQILGAAALALAAIALVIAVLGLKRSRTAPSRNRQAEDNAPPPAAPTSTSTSTSDAGPTR